MLAAPEIIIRFAFSDGTKSFGVALSNLGVAPKVGVAGVAPEVGEKAPLCTPLCTPLPMTRIKIQKSFFSLDFKPNRSFLDQTK